MEEMLENVRAYSMQYTTPGLQLRMTGSAAIGGETLLASRDAIRYTEWITVTMILIILTSVYRAPLHRRYPDDIDCFRCYFFHLLGGTSYSMVRKRNHSRA